jgi:hypothetical protein
LCDAVKSRTILNSDVFLSMSKKYDEAFYKRPPALCRSNPDGVGVAPHCITSRTVLVSHTSTKNSLKFAEMKSQKARTYKVYHSDVLSSELGLSQPLSRQRECLSP